MAGDEHINLAYGGRQEYEVSAISIASALGYTDNDYPTAPEGRETPKLFDRAGRKIYSSQLGPAYVSAIQKADNGLARVDYRGAVISSPEHLARLFSVYRSPRYEHFHSVFVNDDGLVLAHNAITSGVFSRCRVWPTSDPSRGIYDFKRRMERLGATGYYLLHNHPSGNEEASDADLNLTSTFSEAIPGLRAHTIIDHNKYSAIMVSEDSLIVERGSFDYAPSQEVATSITGPDKAAKLMASVIHADSCGALIALDNVHRVAAWRPMATYDYLLAHQFTVESGGSHSIYATSSEDAWYASIATDSYSATMNQGKYRHLLDSILIERQDLFPSYRSAAEEHRLDASLEHGLPDSHSSWKMKRSQLKAKRGYEW